MPKTYGYTVPGNNWGDLYSSMADTWGLYWGGKDPAYYSPQETSAYNDYVQATGRYGLAGSTIPTAQSFYDMMVQGGMNQNYSEAQLRKMAQDSATAAARGGVNVPERTGVNTGILTQAPATTPLPGVSVSPEQLAQMRAAQAGGGIYSVLNPNLNIAPSTAAANLTAYTQKYTNPTATTGLDFLKSLPGTMTLPPTTSPTPNLPATPYGRPRPTATTPTSLRTSFRPQRSKGGFGYIPRSTYGRI